jgi:fatty acid desaturase
MVARAFGRKDLAELSRVAATGHALAGILGLLTALLVVAKLAYIAWRKLGFTIEPACTDTPHWKQSALPA